MSSTKLKAPKPKKSLFQGQGGALKTATVIQSLKSDFGLDPKTLVQLSGYSPRSIGSWSNGKTVTEPAKLKFVELKRLFDALAKLTENKEEVLTWLKEPNEGFEGSTPLQVIARGETDRVWHMIYMLESGQPG